RLMFYVQSSFSKYVVSLYHSPPRSTLIPYTTLFRSSGSVDPSTLATGRIRTPVSGGLACGQLVLGACPETAVHGSGGTVSAPVQDRKSTRLNSSHVAISYAVFFLIKKNNTSLTYSA